MTPSSLVVFLVENGAMLAAGTTGFLAAGAAAVELQKSPIHRQRLGELAVACALAWLVLACVPLPRFPLQPHAPPVAVNPVAIGGVPRLQVQPSEIVLPETPPAEPVPPVAADATTAAPAPAATPAPVVPAPAPPAAAPTEVRRIDVAATLAWVYLIGVTASCAWLAMGRILLARVFWFALPAGHRLEELFRSVSIGHRRGGCRLLISPACDRPLSCGLWRPAILLPSDYAQSPDEAQLRHVLLHELAHLRQRDAWGQALLNLALPLLYWNPLYWALRSRVCFCREMVADDWAAGQSSRPSYAADLVRLARMRAKGAAANLAGIGIFGATTNFYRRMHMLIQRNNPLATRCSRRWRAASAGCCVAALIAATGLFGVRRANAQEREERDQPPAVNRPERARAEREAAETARIRAERDALRKQIEQLDRELAEMRARSAEKDGEARGDELTAKIDRAIRTAEELARQAQEVAREAQRAADERIREVQRLIAERRGERGAPPPPPPAGGMRPPSPPGGRPPVSSNMPPRPEMPTPVPGMPAMPMAPRAGAQAIAPLDLIALANSYVDAELAVKAAKVEYERIARLHNQAAVSDSELQAAQLRIEAAAQKQKLLKAIAEIAMSSTQAQLAQARQKYQAGLGGQEEVIELEGRLKILNMIVKGS